MTTLTFENYRISKFSIDGYGMVLADCKELGREVYMGFKKGRETEDELFARAAERFAGLTPPGGFESAA